MTDQSRTSPVSESGPPWLNLFITALLLIGAWWVITQGSAASWLIGVPAVAAATWAGTRLRRASKLSISMLGMARFTLLFIWESLRGGTDVALRTLSPQMRIQPGFIHYPTHLDNPAALTFFANCVSLLPGTLAADLQGDWLEVHVLNTLSDHHAELSNLERAVARMIVNDGESK